MPDYEIIPPFDDELNRRLGVNEKPDNYRPIGELLEEARSEEREACAVIVETWAQDNETVQPSFTKIAEMIRAQGEANGETNIKGAEVAA